MARLERARASKLSAADYELEDDDVSFSVVQLTCLLT